MILSQQLRSPNHRMANTRILMLFLSIIFIAANPVFIANDGLHDFMVCLGYFLVVLCVLGRVFCSAFIAGKKNSVLITTGPYLMVRNPLYVFSFLGALGISMATGTLTFCFITLLFFTVYYPYIVSKEEEYLTKVFGESYLNYVRAVPRWFPRHLKLSLPETMTTSPAILLKTIIDASLFFLALPIIQLIEKAHAQHLLPTFFNIY